MTAGRLAVYSAPGSSLEVGDPRGGWVVVLMRSGRCSCSAFVALALLAAPAVAAADDADEAAARSLAVFPIQGKLGVKADLAELVADHILQELRRGGAFGNVMSPTEIAQLMPAAEQKTVLECASDECSLIDNELAGALGSTHIVVGNVSKLEQSFLLALKLFDLRQGLVISQVNQRIAGESAEALLDGVKPTVVKLLMGAGMNRFPTSAVFPLASKLGTDATVTGRFSAALLGQIRRWPQAFDLVMGPAEIAQVMSPEQQSVVSSCGGDECAVVDEDLVGVLGVTHVLLGTVAKGDENYLVTVKLIHVKSGVAVGAVSERVGNNEEALMKAAVPVAVKLLVAAKLMEQPAPEQIVPPAPTRRSRLPMLSVAGGAGALGAVSAVIAVAAVAAGSGALVFNLVPELKRPFVSSMSLATRAFVLQAPVVAFVGLGLTAAVVTTLALLVSGGSVLAAWLVAGP